jgi:hypothetical protein
LKKTSQKRAGGVAQGVGPEFKSQCHTCPKKPTFSFSWINQYWFFPVILLLK